MCAAEVMERSVIHAGKVFIKENEENSRAYVIQAGKVRAFKMIGENKIVVKEYGPNTIIGETCLLLDDPITMSYEALCDTTVIAITRQNFEKTLRKCDKTVQTILGHLMAKLQELSKEAQVEAVKASEVDEDAYQLVQGMLRGMGEEKTRKYELAMLPHMNALIKSVKRIKAGTD
jgi:CRP-like cAMP-binding protein